MKGLWVVAALAAAAAARAAIDPADFDPKVGAAHDFYQHVNGGWLRTHPVPPALIAGRAGAILTRRPPHAAFAQLPIAADAAALRALAQSPRDPATVAASS